MHGVPTTRELAEAVREFLQGEVMPVADDRLRFRARVAANVLAQIERELALGSKRERDHQARRARLGVADDRMLALAIRDGSLDGRMQEVLAVLRASAVDKLLVSNPRHLEADDRPAES